MMRGAPAAQEVQPMSSASAVKAYKEGSISKDVAMSQIDKRLDELVINGDISSWEYKESESMYLVLMKNNVVFSYQMN